MSINLSKFKLVPLYLLIFIDSVSFGIVIPVLLRLIIQPEHGLVAETLSLSTRQLLFGICVGAMPLGMVLLGPVVGNLSDKWGRKRILLLCLLASCIGFLLPVFAIEIGSMGLFLFGRFLSGAASSSQPIAQAVITDVSSGKQKAIRIGYIALAMTMAMVIGPLMGGYLSDSHLVSWFNPTTPFYVAFALSLLNLSLLYRCIPETNQHLREKKISSVGATLKTWWAMCQSRTIGCLLLTFFALELAWSLYFQTVSLFLMQQFHYDPNNISLFLGHVGIWMSLGLTFIFQWLLKRLSLIQITYFASLVTVISLFACGISQAIWGQWLYVTFVAIGVGIVYSALLTLMSNHAEKTYQGWMMGIASSTLALAWLITAPLGSWLFTHWQRGPMLVATGTMLAGLMVFWLFAKTQVTPGAAANDPN